MRAYFFKKVPAYRLSGFRAVRDSFDNLSNVLNLAEIINTCAHCRADTYEDDFDFAIFSGDFRRALVRRDDGFFSMSIPFHIIEGAGGISFNFDLIGEEVSGRFISIMRNAIMVAGDGVFSHEDVILSITENFGLELSDAIIFSDAFVSLITEDHGYFRFDDDPDNEDGDVHPRYHFDFFYKNTSSIKIGSDSAVDIECFYSLFDGSRPKRYLRA